MEHFHANIEIKICRHEGERSWESERHSRGKRRRRERHAVRASALEMEGGRESETQRLGSYPSIKPPRLGNAIINSEIEHLMSCAFKFD